MNLRRWLQAWQPKIREFSDTYLTVRSQLNPRLIRWLPDDSRSHLTLLLAHFPSTFLQLQEVCDAAEIPYRICPEPITPAIAADLLPPLDPAGSARRAPVDDLSSVQSPRLILALVDQLMLNAESETRHSVAADVRPRPTGTIPARRKRVGGDVVQSPEIRLAVLVAERHFLRQRDDQVRNFVRQLGCRAEVAFFLALDDPLLRGRCDRMLWQLLEHYGMRPDEPWQSLLLDRLVRRVQKEHAQRNTHPQNAQRDTQGLFVDSADRWLDLQQASQPWQ